MNVADWQVKNTAIKCW